MVLAPSFLSLQLDHKDTKIQDNRYDILYVAGVSIRPNLVSGLFNSVLDVLLVSVVPASTQYITRFSGTCFDTMCQRFQWYQL